MLKGYGERLALVIHRHFPGCRIYLFNIELKKEPDEQGKKLEFSIAIDAGAIQDPGVLGNIYAEINEEFLNLDVDIVDINNVSIELRKEILEKGVILQH